MRGMFGDRSPNTSRRGSSREQPTACGPALGGIRSGCQQGQCEQSPPSNGVHEVRVGKESKKEQYQYESYA
jgi:hypothetical protein